MFPVDFPSIEIWSQFVDKTVWEVFPTEVAENILALVDLALTTRQPQSIEYLMETPNATQYREMWFTAVEEQTCILTVRDISERWLREQQGELVREVTQLCLTAADVEVLYSDVIRLLCERLDFCGGAFAVLDQEHAEVELIAHQDSTGTIAPKCYPVGATFAYDSLRSGHLMLISDPKKEEYSQCPLLRDIVYQSMVALPIALKEEPYGALLLYSFYRIQAF